MTTSLLTRLLLPGLAGISICLGADDETKLTSLSSFAANFDNSLDANQAKGSERPKSGQPDRTKHAGGKKGEALDLSSADHSTSYVTLTYPTDGNFSTEEGTLAFWYKPQFPREITTDLPLASYFLFDLPTSLRDEKNQVVRVSLVMNDNGIRRSLLLNPGLAEGDKPLSQAVNWQPGEWHHIAMTWDTRSIHVYLDGEETEALQSEGGLFGGSKDSVAAMVGVFGLGGAWGSSDKISAGGLIDEFHLYDKALTPHELKQTQ